MSTRAAFPGLLMALPAALALLALLYLPFFGTVLLAFSDWSFTPAPPRFVGLANFERILAEGRLQGTLGNTLLFALMAVCGTLLTGLCAALALERRTVLNGLLRSVALLPLMSASVAMLLVWEMMLNPIVGPGATLFALFGGTPLHWLGEPRLALPTLAVIFVWQNFGLAMVLFLAGLAGTEAQIREAVRIDGAGWADELRIVRLPALAPIALFVFVVALIRALQAFDLVAVLTRGGPDGASRTLIYAIFEEAFRYFRADVAAALSLVFFCLVAAIVLTKVLVLDRAMRGS